ncbi:MAG TPA: hypothetical protein PKZ67_11635, partial [Accumulibacter sp.]|nr:hypothetical protein [Accumulibacter sp.]
PKPVKSIFAACTPDTINELTANTVLAFRIALRRYPLFFIAFGFISDFLLMTLMTLVIIESKTWRQL